jgi:hypothetical protein
MFNLLSPRFESSTCDRPFESHLLLCKWTTFVKALIRYWLERTPYSVSG